MTSPDSEIRRPTMEGAGVGAAPNPRPDVGFTLGAGLSGEPEDVAAPDPPPASVPAGAPDDPDSQARDLAVRIGRALAAEGPEGWYQLTAVFAVTVAAAAGQVIYADEQQRIAPVEPSPEVLELVVEQRHAASTLGDGPWWRLLVELDIDGQLVIDYDYGAEPFPEDHLFAPQAYLADLEVYPRERLPLWLAAYIGHADRQSRSPAQAALEVREDRATGVRATVSESDFPDLPTMWARWAVLSAAFVAVGSEWGPRVLPAVGWFEGARRSGSTLYLLPKERAVLSGGVWNSPVLDAAYHGEGPMPRLYSGAPEWIVDPLLNSRAGGGLLSFCYWWENGRWYRGESRTADESSAALPGVWAAETVIEVICGLIGPEPDDVSRAAVAELVAAAETDRVTRANLVAVFGAEDGFDVDNALSQLTMAGIDADEAPETESDRQVRAVGRADTPGAPVGSSAERDGFRVAEFDQERVR